MKDKTQLIDILKFEANEIIEFLKSARVELYRDPPPGADFMKCVIVEYLYTAAKKIEAQWKGEGK